MVQWAERFVGVLWDHRIEVAVVLFLVFVLGLIFAARVAGNESDRAIRSDENERFR